jgi:hypothetical protein
MLEAMTEWTEVIGNVVTVFAVVQLMSGIQVCVSVI